MNKQDLAAMVAEILAEREPMVKASDYRPTAPGPEQRPTGYSDGDFVPDVTELDLRKLYLVEQPENGEKFRKMKERTPARLGSGKAGPRYKTLTMLRFRADHAAAQDAVFSQVSQDFAAKNGMVEVQTRCSSKDEYLTRPDLGRTFDEENAQKIRSALPQKPRVQIVVGDGLSSAAITANAMDCLEAIREGLKIRGIDAGTPIFVRYCRVGAGDAIGDITGCELCCMLVGERPGLVTDKSMSAYLTYGPHTGIPEAGRSVVSNIHAQGTPAVEAGAHIAGLIETMLLKKASGLALQEAGGMTKVLAVRYLANASPALCRQLGAPAGYPALGILTTDCDDATYIALDAATKAAEVEVAYGGSFYAGAANASTPYAGEVIGILAARTPGAVKSGMEAALAALERLGFDEVNGVPYLAYTVSSVGSFLAKEAGVRPGTALAYLIAPPLEGMYAMDAALKASDTTLQKLYTPPSPTNFGGGLLSGTQSACEAACAAFAEAVREVAERPVER